MLCYVMNTSLTKFNDDYSELLWMQESYTENNIYYDCNKFIILIDDYFSSNACVLSQDYYDDITSSDDSLYILFRTLTAEHFKYICMHWKIYHVILCRIDQVVVAIAKCYTDDKIFQLYSNEEKDYIFHSRDRNTLLTIAVYHGNKELIMYSLDNGYFMFDSYNVMTTDDITLKDDYRSKFIGKKGLIFLLKYKHEIKLFQSSLRNAWILSIANSEI